MLGALEMAAKLAEHYLFGLMGERLTRRVRILTLTAMLRQEVGGREHVVDQEGRFSASMLTSMPLHQTRMLA